MISQIISEFIFLRFMHISRSRMGMEDLKNSDKVEIEVTDGTYLYLRRCRYFSKICAQNYWPYCVKSLLQILNAFLSLLSMQDIRDVVRGRLRGL